MYRIFYSTGLTSQHDTLPEAFGELLAEYPDLYAIHEVGASLANVEDAFIEGEDDGYSVIVWENEVESIDDTGAAAVARIFLEGDA